MNCLRFINCQRSGVGWVNATLVLVCSNILKQVNKERRDEHVYGQAKC